MKMPWESAAEGIIGLVSEFIEDPDKKAELNYKVKEMFLTSKTTPKIDAFVKLMMALRDVIIPMFRPLGSLGMAAFGAYCLTNNIVLPEYITAGLFGAPVAWGASRYKEKTEAMKYEDTSWDDDEEY